MKGFFKTKKRKEKKENIPPFPRQNPICPGLLIPPPPIHKPPPRIDLQTPKNILGKRYPAIIRWISMVVHVDIPPTTTSTRSALATCSARTISSGGDAAETGTRARTKIEAAGGG